MKVYFEEAFEETVATIQTLNPIEYEMMMSDLQEIKKLENDYWDKFIVKDSVSQEVDDAYKIFYEKCEKFMERLKQQTNDKFLLPVGYWNMLYNAFFTNKTRGSS